MDTDAPSHHGTHAEDHARRPSENQTCASRGASRTAIPRRTVAMKSVFFSMIVAIFIFSIFTATRSAEQKLPAATPQLIALGKQIYAQQCVACHGPGGRG